MLNQPSQPKLRRIFGAPGAKAGARAGAKCGKDALLKMAVLAAPITPMNLDTVSALQGAPDSPFATIIAVISCVLGVSASLLYRHMHHREDEIRRRAENADAELRAVLMMTNDAVLVLSADGMVRAANAASEEVFGCATEEIIGEPITELFSHTANLAELTKQGPASFETTVKRWEDCDVKVEVALSSVELNGGKGYCALVRETRADSSEAHDAPPAVPQQAVGKFTHDLNNQLTAVLGNLSLILMSAPGDPLTRERVLNAKKTALAAQSLCMQLQSTLNPAAETQRAALPATQDRTILTMPVSQPAPAVSPAKAGPARILILDDEEAICVFVASVLDASGFEAVSANSISAALHACDESLRESRPFGLLITDLSLPGDATGVEALKQIRSILPDIKAIISSGYEADPAVREYRRHGFNAVMTKPYDVDDLARTVTQVLATGGVSFRKTA